MLQLPLVPQRTPQLPLVTFDHLCWDCEHAVSHMGLKIGVAQQLTSQLGVDTLLKSKWLLSLHSTQKLEPKNVKTREVQNHYLP
jgi:hypothetical protein